MTSANIARELSNIRLHEITDNVANSTGHVWRAGAADTLPVVCRLRSEPGQVPDCRWEASVTQLLLLGEAREHT